MDNRKRELRQLIRAKKKEYGKAERDLLSAQIEEKLLADTAIKAANTILAYYSLPDEVGTHHLIDVLRQQGKKVLLPVIVGEGELDLIEYKGVDHMQTDSYGILEPIGEPFTDYQHIDVAIIPGMAFDRDGNRMGRGKGFYDRLLPKLTDARKIGICFAFQLLEHIPTEAHDRPMDVVITN